MSHRLFPGSRRRNPNAAGRRATRDAGALVFTRGRVAVLGTPDTDLAQLRQSLRAVAATVKELIGDLGTPVSAHASLGAYETLRLARNRFADTVGYRLPYDYSHEWDYLQWYLGPIARVAAGRRAAGDRA